MTVGMILLLHNLRIWFHLDSVTIEIKEIDKLTLKQNHQTTYQPLFSINHTKTIMFDESTDNLCHYSSKRTLLTMASATT